MISSRPQYDCATREVQDSQSKDSKIENYIPLSLLTNEETRKLEPELILGEFGAIWAPSCARVSSEILVRALVQACKKLGVKIFENTPISKLRIQKGCLSGIETKTDFVSTKKIIVASGCETPKLDPVLSRFTPTEPVKGQAVLVQVNKLTLRHVIRWQGIFLRPWGIRSIALGSTTERGCGYNIETTKQGTKELRVLIVTRIQ